MAKKVESIKHKADKRAHIPSKEEAGYEVTQRPTAYCNFLCFDFVLSKWKKHIGKNIWLHGNHQAIVRKSIAMRMD